MELLFILDISLFLILLVLGNLSARIGEALQIPPFYRIFYIEAITLAILPLVDLIFSEFLGQKSDSITIYIRAIAIIPAFPVSYRYWKWLLRENLR